MAYLLGIDVGSTSIKAFVYDDTGQHISSGTTPTPLSHPNADYPAWAVWEHKKIWDGVVIALREALSGVEHPQDIKAVAVTGLGMDGIPLDKSGKELYDFISWHCPRTVEQSRRFSQEIGAFDLFQKTGKQVMHIDSIYRMIWMKENHPEIIEQTDTWLLIEDYINFKLCGVKSIDYSMAATTSVFSQETRDWCWDLIDRAGIPRHIFPKACLSGTPLGVITREAAELTGLSTETMVIQGGHDYICAALGVGAIDEHSTMNIMGTWEMLIQPVTQINITRELFDSGYYIEGHCVEGAYCYVGAFVSGDMSEWLKDQLCLKEELLSREKGTGIWGEIALAAAARPIGSHGCVFLPHFSGSGVPKFDPNSRGAFIGLSNATTRADMMRAVFEGLNFQFRSLMEALTANSLCESSRIICTGGAARNEFWMQNKADIIGLTLEVPEVYEATTLGAAMVAGIGAGVVNDKYDAVSRIRSGVRVREYTPDMSVHEQYEDLYAIFCRLYDDLIATNTMISERNR